MDTLLTGLETVGFFLVGLIARIGLVIAVVLLVVAAVMPIVFAIRGVVRLGQRAQGISPEGSMMFKPKLHYAPGHTWLEAMEAGTVRVGIDDLARRIVPGAPAVELPAVGALVHKGDAVATMKTGNRIVRVRAPVDGVVASVNSAVRKDGTLPKRHPYGRGWLFTMVPLDTSFEQLPSGDDARSFLRTEHERLEAFFEKSLGYAAADGGELVAEPATLLDDAHFAELAESFVG